ncbi:MAG: DUF3318 domain-containing protein [Cyanobacteria bacterium P01_A01_bin.114]
MALNEEIPRLRDLLPASGRMKIRIVSNPRQVEVIKAEFPKPWKSSRLVSLNFDLWQSLSIAQRDLLFLRAAAWIETVQPLRIDVYQGVAAAGLLGFLVELSQFDAIGVLTAGGLTAFAGAQIWRNSRGTQAEVAADEAAIKIAQRRGYTEATAAQEMLAAIEATARLEGRSNLSFSELTRTQNLRAIANLGAASARK